MIDIIDYLCQGVIICTGFTSLYLFASQDAKTRMWAGVIGLIGEPFWLTTAFINGQWGVVLLAMVYGVNWVRVIYSNYRCTDYYYAT